MVIVVHSSRRFGYRFRIESVADLCVYDSAYGLRTFAQEYSGMVKKTKTTGKNRLDKFYYLAKEQGFRSRAAFKLIQLNKKHDFLRSAKSLIDLCAAPGGWLQVAAKFMPVGSTIIGVDLDPIRAIPNVITMQHDITTPACKAALKKALGGPTKLADVVLHDGSPNVGGAWAKEAYTQSELVLHSTKIAAEMLRPGGTFISKVFRSQDYNNLLWVLKQLFENVSVTKPEASRASSAEIYFVCMRYKAPKSIDPRMFNPSFVFKGVDPKKTFNPEENADVKKITIANVDKHIQMRQNARDGYEEGVMVLHRKYPVVKFIQSDAPVNILAEYNELIFDEDSKIIDDHSYTTDEIRALCKDLRVIGKSDMKILIKWQKKMDEHLKALRKAEISSSQEKVEVKEPNEEEIEALRDEKLQKAIDAMKKRDLARQKRLKRKHKEQRAKAKEISDVAGDQNDQEHSEMFNLKYVTTEDVLERLQNDNIAEVESSDESDSEQDESKDIDMFLDADLIREREIEEELDAMFSDYKARRKEADRRARKKARQMGIVDDNDEELKTSESEQEQEEDEEEIDEVSEDEQLHETILDDSDASKAKHPLNVELYPAPTQEEVADMWFERDLLKDIDLEIKNPSTKAGSKPYGPELPASLKRKRAAEQFAEESDAEDEAPVEKKHSKKKADDDFEVVEKETYSDFSDDSDAVAETLAIGTAMLRKKRREQILDDSYNRYAFDDDADLPEWFLDDQQKFNKASKPITRSEIEYFKERFKAISARPLKKIAEAKARKKVRALRRWEKVKGQADSIAASEELSTGEKFKRLEKLYQKKREKKREKVYAVSKKSGGTRDVKRKPGSMIVRVDSRMKKDKRGEKARNKRKSRGRGRH